MQHPIITTQYIGPRGSRGSVIRAGAAGTWTHFGVDNSVSIDDNHREAAMAFARRREWAGQWHNVGHIDNAQVWACIAGVPAFTVQGR